MSGFSVFTTDGRSSVFEESDGITASVFIVRWKEAVVDPEKTWPWAYMAVEGMADEVVHFNPMTITAVSTVVKR